MKIPPVGDGGEPVSQKNIFHETLFGGIALSDQFRVGPVDFLVLLVKGAGILAVRISQSSQAIPRFLRRHLVR